jgi:hypothetical protein
LGGGVLSDIVKEIRSVWFIPRGGLLQDKAPGWTWETHPAQRERCVTERIAK